MQVSSLYAIPEMLAAPGSGGSGTAIPAANPAVGVSWTEILALVAGQAAAGLPLPEAVWPAADQAGISDTGEDEGVRPARPAPVSKPAGRRGETAQAPASAEPAEDDKPAAERPEAVRCCWGAVAEHAGPHPSPVVLMSPAALPSVWPAATHPDPGAETGKESEPRVKASPTPRPILAAPMASGPATPEESTAVRPSPPHVSGRSPADPIPFGTAPGVPPVNVLPPHAPVAVLTPGSRAADGPAPPPPAGVELPPAAPAPAGLVAEPPALRPTGREIPPPAPREAPSLAHPGASSPAPPAVPAATEPARQPPGERAAGEIWLASLRAAAAILADDPMVHAGRTVQDPSSPGPAARLSPDSRTYPAAPAPGAGQRQAGVKQEPAAAEIEPELPALSLGHEPQAPAGEGDRRQMVPPRAVTNAGSPLSDRLAAGSPLSDRPARPAGRTGGVDRYTVHPQVLDSNGGKADKPTERTYVATQRQAERERGVEAPDRPPGADDSWLKVADATGPERGGSNSGEGLLNRGDRGEWENATPAPAARTEATDPTPSPSSYRPWAATTATFSRRLVDQVERLQQMREERRLSDPVHRISMLLEPPELGMVEATVDLRHGEVRVRLAAHTAAGEAALAGRLESLRAAMTERGLTVAELRVIPAGSASGDAPLQPTVGGFIAGQGFQGNGRGGWYAPGDDESPPLRTGTSFRRRPAGRTPEEIKGGGPVGALRPVGWPEGLVAGGLDVTA